MTTKTELSSRSLTKPWHRSCSAINLERGDIIRNMSHSHSSPVTSPTMIGREAQLVLLADLLTQASGGQSRIALVAGEAGIGKSRLVAEVTAIGARHGALIVQGRCFEQGRLLPYAPLIDLLRVFCGGRSADVLLRALGATAAELVKISPDLAT